MRIFYNLEEAALEVRRDVYKGIPQKSTRVQQFVGQELDGRERFGYDYQILGGIPTDVEDLLDLADKVGFLDQWSKRWPQYDRDDWASWIVDEAESRLNPGNFVQNWDEPNEGLHPALIKTFEGKYPSYVYGERLQGMFSAMIGAFRQDLDTRRAYWPIFLPMDSMRASRPTRVPCSIGYHFMVRQVGDKLRMLMTYIQRSCDFDTFWFTDVYFANLVREKILEEVNLNRSILSRINDDDLPPEPILPGLFTHVIFSLHSFDVVNHEIY